MIAKLRLLERVRARALDRRRADQARATIACAEADAAHAAAVTAFETTLARPVVVIDIEQANAGIESAGLQIERAERVREQMRQRTAAAGLAWHRADQSLARARAERVADKQRDEQREHDELATRRTK